MLRSLGVGLVLVATASCTGETINGGGGDGGGSASGAATIASLIQATPTHLVSDGTSLFWIADSSGGAEGSGSVWSMPVGGGTIKIVAGMVSSGTENYNNEPVSTGFLAVDDVNVYYSGGGAQGGIPSGLYRAPKGSGGKPALVNESGATPLAETVLGTRAYWAEEVTGASTLSPLGGKVAVKSTPLQGGAVQLVGEFTVSDGDVGNLGIAVTGTTAFILPFGSSLSSFPLASGVPDGGTLATVAGDIQPCILLISDIDAVTDRRRRCR
jgi:hypothetical protein